MIKDILANDKLLSLQRALQQNESILVEDLWNAPKALIASLAQQATGKHILILTGASQEEIRLFHDFNWFSNTLFLEQLPSEMSVVDFPAWESIPSDNIAPSPDIVGERYKVLQEISTTAHPYVILSSLQACLQRLIDPKKFRELYLTLRVGETHSFDHLMQRLVSMGYRRTAVASDKGEFAVRGGIIDIFPVSTPDPYRIEFWGDEVESIRIYDPIGQKSVRPAEYLELPPAQELEILKESSRLCTILDYLGTDTIVIFDDILALEDRYASLVNIGGSASQIFCSMDQFLDQMKPMQKIFLSQQPVEELSEVHLLDKDANFYSKNTPLSKISFQMFNRDLIVQRWQHPFLTLSDFLFSEQPESVEVTGDELFLALGHLAKSDYRLHILCGTEPEESSFREKLALFKINLPHLTQFHIGYLSSGFVEPESKIIVFPLTEITQRYKIRRQKQRSTYHFVPSEVHELIPGDAVVHLNNGIGRYLGLEKKVNHSGLMTEFLRIEYAEKATLYVPISQANLVTKYIGSGEDSPKLHTLGSNRWKRIKEQTELAITKYATELLEFYAQRAIQEGMVYPEDSPDMQAFEEEFPFVETEDQLAAISDIKKDMLSKQTMDRLICGDVGYGKTEVAMRAAFKAVIDGQKQVAVLVPTTVLAMQHYENFIERMSHFPVNVSVLSRFRTAKQMRETLQGLADGSIDIVIGTHRLISEDVKFKNLGLIVIDEEQRFGVKTKEHLKRVKLNIDCLTLSATPIPRTLYMSLIGVRDMSVISTPPQDRLPISTFIAEPHELVMKNALLRELSRDGQAFIIHNRIDTIFEFAARIKKMLPQARIVVAHGQMHSDEIDQVFHAFKSGQADILVATSIVENGIDIPNANTILIDRADRFGMADLYQMRGRVGRWNRRAYAYFLVKNIHLMPEIARKRLEALASSSGQGGGMKIAMHDLEIRGAGNILGLEQSGHVSAIGFHLYCKLLKRTILTFQGKISANICDTKFEFSIDARLPEEYINEVSLRMEIYQRLGEALSWEDIDLIWEEVKDRFGAPPEPALWLYHLSRVRVFASLRSFTALKFDKAVLHADQKLGKEVNTRRIVLGKLNTPKEFEEVIIKALKKEFSLKN